MKKYLLSILTLTMSMVAMAQKNNPPGLDLVKEADLKKDLYEFAAPHFNGRSAGTLDELKASMWMAEKYREIGLLPAGCDASALLAEAQALRERLADLAQQAAMSERGWREAAERENEGARAAMSARGAAAAEVAARAALVETRLQELRQDLDVGEAGLTA